MRSIPSSSNPVHLAIVSPCSTCHNQLATSKDGKPACPRRVMEQSVRDEQEAGNPITNITHLALYGTEGSPQEGDGSYRNPVYWDTGHAILVWVAFLEDNAGRADGTNTLLDPAFDTSTIQCRSLPVVPRDNEAAYFQKGALREGNHLEVTISPRQQMTADGSATPVLVDGFAQQTNFAFNHPRTLVSKDLCPSGT